MKTILIATFQLVICGLETVALSVSMPTLNINSVVLARTVQASDCLRNMTIQLNANPSNIVYGQSSLVSWSVSLPAECGFTSIQLNGQPVAPFGSQTVTPIQSTTYRVIVFLNFGGVSTEKTAFTRVKVNDSATYFWCPYLLPPESLDSSQAYPPIGTKDNEPIVQWLDESLNVPATSFLLGSGLILDYNDTSSNDFIPAFGSGIPLLSACAFMPVQPRPDLNPLIPEQVDPTADPSAT